MTRLSGDWQQWLEGVQEEAVIIHGQPRWKGAGDMGPSLLTHSAPKLEAKEIKLMFSIEMRSGTVAQSPARSFPRPDRAMKNAPPCKKLWILEAWSVYHMPNAGLHCAGGKSN